MWQRFLHQGSKAYRSYVSSTEMKNAWSFASTSSHFYKICIWWNTDDLITLTLQVA
jgi:hypothetical protein